MPKLLHIFNHESPLSLTAVKTFRFFHLKRGCIATHKTSIDL